MSGESTESLMPSSSNSSTYFRQEIMKGTLPGPWKARLVIRGNTSPVEIARSEIVPIFSPAESTTGFPSIWDR